VFTVDASFLEKVALELPLDDEEEAPLDKRGFFTPT
jgi:hypothetical protein